jgi:hypothetical protein
MEIQVLLETLLRKAPGYTLDRDRARRYERTGTINGWHAMPAEVRRV